MAYAGTTSTSPNAPQMVSQGVTGMRTWYYASTHAAADIDGANFFTDGLELGFVVGDQLINQTTAYVLTSHAVTVVGSTTTTVSAGSTVS